MTDKILHENINIKTKLLKSRFGSFKTIVIKFIQFLYFNKFITGLLEYNQNNNFTVKLPTRNFERYSNNINLGFLVNKIRLNKNHNFISYLGKGGLSNLWGQIINTKINFSDKIIRFSNDLR